MIKPAAFGLALMTLLIALIVQSSHHHSHSRYSIARLPSRLSLGQIHADKEVQYSWRRMDSKHWSFYNQRTHSNNSNGQCHGWLCLQHRCSIGSQSKTFVQSRNGLGLPDSIHSELPGHRNCSGRHVSTFLGLASSFDMACELLDHDFAIRTTRQEQV